MESGELRNPELISLAKREGRRLIKAIETQDIAMGNHAIKSMKSILDASINSLDFDPLWHTGPIEYQGREFCFTGKFQTGTKEQCWEMVIERGGRISKSVNLRIDYLIVGGEKSNEWAHENYGRKIERALEIRKDRRSEHPRIVAETDWIKSL